MLTTRPPKPSRPTLRVENDVREDVGTMRVKNWSKLALGSAARKRIVEQAKAHKELQLHEKKSKAEGRTTVGL